MSGRQLRWRRYFWVGQFGSENNVELCSWAGEQGKGELISWFSFVWTQGGSSVCTQYLERKLRDGSQLILKFFPCGPINLDSGTGLSMTWFFQSFIEKWITLSSTYACSLMIQRVGGKQYVYVSDTHDYKWIVEFPSALGQQSREQERRMLKLAGKADRSPTGRASKTLQWTWKSLLLA